MRFLRKVLGNARPATSVPGAPTLRDLARAGDAIAVRAAIAAGADVNEGALHYYPTTPLGEAAVRGHADCVKALIDAHADLNPRDTKGRTPLMLSVGGADEVTGPKPGAMECVHFLIAAGADVNARDSDGGTALMKAAYTGDLGMLTALVAAGADVHAQIDGFTALTQAAYMHRAHCVAALIAIGADVNVRHRTGQTPLMFAVRNADVESVGTLIAAGAHVDATEYEYGNTALTSTNSPTMIKILIAAGADVNVKRMDGATALIKTAGYGKAECVDLLVAAGADVNARDHQGMTPLRGALNDAQKMDSLVRAGADINARDLATGFTPVMWAVVQHELDAIKALIAAGADLTSTDVKGQTALMLAREKEPDRETEDGRVFRGRMTVVLEAAAARARDLT
jgi:ankyrin repeat protein